MVNSHFEESYLYKRFIFDLIFVLFPLKKKTCEIETLTAKYAKFTQRNRKEKATEVSIFSFVYSNAFVL